MKQPSLEARAAGTVPPSVPSASPARLPHGLSLPRRALLALESLGTCPSLTFAIPLGCSRSAKLDSGQCWQLGQSSAQLLGLGKKSQAVPASFSEKYLEKRGGDLFKMQIHSSPGEIWKSPLLLGSPGNLATSGCTIPFEKTAV